MKKAFNAVHCKTVLSLAAGVALASGFWIASTPVAKGVQKTPAELVQSNLPSNKTIADASEEQLLEAVCKAVKQSPNEAGLIVRTAAGARQDIRTRVLCTAAKCGRTHGDDIKGNRCTWVIDVVRDWIKQDPKLASQLTESIADCSPDCRDNLQVALISGKDVPGEGPGVGEFGGTQTVPMNMNPPSGSAGGGSSTAPGQDKCTVCHNGHEISIPCEQTNKFLDNHPGDQRGPCQATPVTNP